MEQDLRIDYARDGQKVVLTASGKIDSASVTLFNNMLNKAKQETSFIDVNMRAVTFLSSMGIRAILLAYRQLKANKGEFRIVSPSEPVKNVIGMVNMNLMLAK